LPIDALRAKYQTVMCFAMHIVTSGCNNYVGSVI